MADDTQRLIVSLEAQTRQFTNALNRANGVVNSRAKAIESRFNKMNKNINSSFSNSLRGGVAALGGALGVREVTRYADAWTEAGNKIAAASQIAGVQARSISEINKIAEETRTGITETADLYAKLTRSASGFVETEEDIARATEIVNKAFKAGGAALSEQNAGILQLAQGLGSGFLQGDELRSIRENAPLLAAALAKEFETTIGGLKELGAEGKITTDRIIKAILNGAPEIEGAFNKTNATIADGFTNLKNKLTEYIGTQAQVYGVTETVNSILGSLANNIGSVATAAAAAGVVLAATFGGGAIIASVAALANPFVLMAAAIGSAAFALSAFGDEITPIQGDIANLQDYASEIWDNIKEGAANASEVVSNAFMGIMNAISTALGGGEVSFADLADLAISAADKIVNAFAFVYDTLVITFTKLPSAIADNIIGAMNTMIEKVEGAINKIISGVNRAISAINGLGGAVGIENVIPTVGEIDLGRLKNDYAGAGAAAAEAYAQALADTSKTRIRDALGNLRDAANERGAVRTINQTPFQTLPGAFGEPDANNGFGNGTKTDPKGGSKKKNALEREIEQIKERTASLQAETAAQAALNPLINDYEYAVTKASAVQDLLNAAQNAGIKITPELRDKINELAESYAIATVEANKLAESQERAKKLAGELNDTAKDAFGGFIKDLKAGKSATEALAGALDKVADKLFDIALDSLFNPIGSGAGGLLGGALSGIGKIFGLAKGGVVANGRPLPTFARGGVSKSAAIFGEAGPEAAVPLPDGRRIPVDLRIPQGGKNGGSQPVAISVSVEGANGDAHVIDLVRQGVQTGLSQYNKQLDRTMGSRVAQAQTRQL